MLRQQLHCGGRECSQDNPRQSSRCHCCGRTVCVTCAEACECYLGVCVESPCRVELEAKEEG
jgi:hypothetical protein